MMTKTKKRIKTSIALAAVVGFTSLGVARAADAPASAPEKTVMDALSLEAGVDVYSHYVWRGLLLTDAPVMQPSVTLGFGGLALNVWGSFDITNENEGNDNDDFRLQELDFTLSYDMTVADIVNLGVGYIEYTFPGTIYERTSEVYASVGVDCLLAPSLTVYYDFDEFKSFYANLGIGHTFELTESLGLSLGAALGWGDKNYFEGYVGAWTNPQARLADYNLSASLDYAVTDKLGISLIVAYSDFINNEVHDAIEDSGGEAGTFYGGASISLSF